MFTNAYFFRVMASADQDHMAQNVQPDLLSVLSAFVETVFNSSRWQPIMCDYFGLNSLNENVFQICLNAKKKILKYLTHSHTMTPFDAPGKQAF